MATTSEKDHDYYYRQYLEERYGSKLIPIFGTILIILTTILTLILVCISSFIFSFQPVIGGDSKFKIPDDAKSIIVV